MTNISDLSLAKSSKFAEVRKMTSSLSLLQSFTGGLTEDCGLFKIWKYNKYENTTKYANNKTSFVI